ncbi:PAS domain S-box protein [Aggregicoccus sp. 17bor-14]|uniref:sensor histidine kinase n=1 Tax=Myxococcaceae TaxID=31 RepID=UPI00129CCA64|nr:MULTISPECIES: PAS domain-containing protein [Myxococcaceae]MBF5044970.1 PAS domain-containing protein [Simulacricoccus sp. 17bor-14]MRI90713.1 PAS domain S-box protein [Aggregicoccus sp. 17bor-14]
MTATIDFQQLFEHSPNPYMLLDRELRYVAANRAYLRVTASRLEELLGRNILDAFPNDPADPNNASATMLRESLHRVLASGQADTLALIPYRVPKETPGGPVLVERFWSATHTPILDARGEVAFLLQHTVDVTELQQLKQAAAAPLVEAGVLQRAAHVQEANRSLHAETQHLRRLFKQAPGFTAFLRGREHVFELANDSYYQLVGHRDILGKPVREALPEVAGQGYFELLDQVFTSGEAFVGHDLRVLLQREPGAPLAERFLDLVYQPIVEPDGRVSGIFVQGNDITAQRHAQEQIRHLNASLEARVQERTAELQQANQRLQEVDRLKGDFLGGASYQLSSPLHAILGATDVLESTSPSKAQQPYLRRIAANAEVLLATVSGLLDMSRLSTRRLQLRRDPVDLLALVREVWEQLRPLAEQQGQRVVLQLPDTLPALQEADEERLHAVVITLVHDALRLTPAASLVRISVLKAQGQVQLEVRHTGSPLPPETLERLFQRFTQLRGTWVELSVARALVEAHGGSLTARAESDGNTFTLSLPLRGA